MTGRREDPPAGDEPSGEDALEFLEGKSGRLLHRLGTVIDLLGESLEEGMPEEERSRVVADLERLTRVVARFRKIVLEERAGEAHGASETLLDLMREDEEAGTSAPRRDPDPWEDK